MDHQHNITRIKAVSKALEEYAGSVVFTGGATVSFYADRPAGEIRPTDDVDILIEIFTHNHFAEVEEKLRKKGFQNDTASGIICRYIINGIIVDIMPTSPGVLGFSNKWYPEAFHHSIQKDIGDCIIKLLSPVYFLATKIEAWKGRGNNDGRTSTDFEDIVFILNNCSTIWDEMRASPVNLKSYLQAEFATIIKQPYLQEWVSCHLDFSEQRRLTYVIAGIEDFLEDGTLDEAYIPK